MLRQDFFKMSKRHLEKDESLATTLNGDRYIGFPLTLMFTNSGRIFHDFDDL